MTAAVGWMRATTEWLWMQSGVCVLLSLGSLAAVGLQHDMDSSLNGKSYFRCLLMMSTRSVACRSFACRCHFSSRPGRLRKGRKVEPRRREPDSVQHLQGHQPIFIQRLAWRYSATGSFRHLTRNRYITSHMSCLRRDAVEAHLDAQ